METKKRTPVPLSDSERDEIETAMRTLGFSAMADFLRYSALQVARQTQRGAQ